MAQSSSTNDVPDIDANTIKEFVDVTNKVYGVYTPPKESNDNQQQDTTDSIEWVPKSYKYRQKRYLWTDAFGVTNYLSLYEVTKDRKYLRQAELLIIDVHNTLGFTRDGKSRLGKSTKEHPLLGGLRIGKIANENEQDGDGQYFHYLTKWMFALYRMSIITNKLYYNEWAIELAKSIFPYFVNNNKKSILNFGRPRMYWKLSIDLTHPLVNSEGNLDPIDGYVTYKLLHEQYIKMKQIQIQTKTQIPTETEIQCEDNKIDEQKDDISDSNSNSKTSKTSNLNIKNDNLDLSNEIEIFEKIVNEKYSKYKSSDTLDLGESLWLSHWFLNEKWSQHITYVALKSLDRIYKYGEFDNPSHYRLAFREFGTTLGIQTISYQLENMKNRNKKMEQAYNIAKKWKMNQVPNLLSFWKKNGIYTRDNDITPVMYCSSLIPGLWMKNAKLIK